MNRKKGRYPDHKTEAESLTETEYHISTLPDGLKLALLSDLHGRDHQSVIASLKNHRPAIICITGDFIYGSYPKDDASPLTVQSNVLPFLAACGSIAPTYVSFGNHEYMLDDEDLRTIESTGVTVLDNSFVQSTVNGSNLVIGGLTSAYAVRYRRFRKTREKTVDADISVSTADGVSADVAASTDMAASTDVATSTDVAASSLRRYPRMETEPGGRYDLKIDRTPDTAWMKGFTTTPGYHILLSHHPEYVDFFPPTVELILSGHAHGGQWRFYNPFKREWFGMFSPGQGWWPKLTSGVHEISSGVSEASGASGATATLIISRGLANTASLPRINNAPEVVYITGSRDTTNTADTRKCKTK